ncbi:MAG: hypothetical protein ACOH2E_06190 [Candidatus Paracaedibacter sp.]
MTKNFISLLSFFTISLFLILNENISASDYFNEKGEKELYDQGIIYRNRSQWQEAIGCFEPLAQKKYAKAQHNLATCLFNIGDEWNVYQWYKTASCQGLEPSTKNLAKMNLLCLLLPNEVFDHIVSFFSMKDIYHCNTLCHKTHEAVRSTVTRTNFLTSKSPYAIQFFFLFKDVHFDPMPKELRLSQLAKVESGSIEVHFRDTEHLKNIVEEIQLLECSGRLYFVFDKSVQDGEELVTTEGVLQKEYFINFIADTPLKLSGRLDLNTLSYMLRLPQGSDSNALNLKKRGTVLKGDLGSYTKAFALASVIDTFNDRLFQIRTTDAYQLLEDRQKSRFRSPKMYPDLLDLCPDACLISSSNIEIVQKDYISAIQPFIYVSNSVTGITELQNKLPDFSKSISYINTDISEPGVYCEGPLILQKGFEVFSDKDLTIGGDVAIYDHNLKVISNSSIWIMGSNIIVGGGIYIYAGGSLLNNGYAGRSDYKKPDGMPEEDWRKLLEFWVRSGRIQ